MNEFYDRQKAYWDSLATLDPDASIIDPRDKRGYKNAYLAQMRDSTLREALGVRVSPGATLLDYGCGTGSATIALTRLGYSVVGADLSTSLLSHARHRCGDQRALFVAVDGRSVPLRDHSMDAAIAYSVFCYVTDEAEATALLAGIRKTLIPGSPLLIIEQARRHRTVCEQGLKVQRTTDQWRGLLAGAGFKRIGQAILRHGRFPTTPLIRHGLVPRGAWSALMRAERAIPRITGVWPWDYADVLFSAEA